MTQIIARMGDREEMYNATPEQVMQIFEILESDPVETVKLKRPEEIKQIICDYLHIKAELLAAKTRKREIVYARQMLCYLIHPSKQLSLKSVGAMIGHRDHTTVMHSKETFKNLYDTDESVRLDYHNVLKLIRS